MTRCAWYAATPCTDDISMVIILMTTILISGAEGRWCLRDGWRCVNGFFFRRVPLWNCLYYVHADCSVQVKLQTRKLSVFIYACFYLFWGFSCKYNFISASYSYFIYLPLMLYKVSNWLSLKKTPVTALFFDIQNYCSYLNGIQVLHCVKAYIVFLPYSLLFIPYQKLFNWKYRSH
jgi:hypothetical protein